MGAYKDWMNGVGDFFRETATPKIKSSSLSVEEMQAAREQRTDQEIEAARKRSAARMQGPQNINS